MAEEKAAEAAEETVSLTPDQVRDQEVNDIIRKYMYGGVAAGLVPWAAADMVAITAVQLKMLHSISKLYDISFKENLAKPLVASLIGGLGTPAVALGIFGSAVKVVPLIGHTLSAITLPILAGASTYAVGHIFAQHFASGGTFLNFDPEAMRAHFAELYATGKEEAKKK